MYSFGSSCHLKLDNFIVVLANFHYCRFSGEPVKKRSKLVLPAPQISDGELEEVNTNDLSQLSP